MPNGGKRPGAGRKKGVPQGKGHFTPTIWVLESMAKRGYKFEEEMVNALKNRDWELMDRLIKIAPMIANRPKETVGLEGIEGLVIKDFVNPKNEEGKTGS